MHVSRPPSPLAYSEASSPVTRPVYSAENEPGNQKSLKRLKEIELKYPTLDRDIQALGDRLQKYIDNQDKSPFERFPGPTWVKIVFFPFLALPMVMEDSFQKFTRAEVYIEKEKLEKIQAERHRLLEQLKLRI